MNTLIYEERTRVTDPAFSEFAQTKSGFLLKT
jgi:hypothetical protein